MSWNTMIIISVVVVGGIITLAKDGYQVLTIFEAIFTWTLGITIVLWLVHNLNGGWHL
jgi:hypothetical protein